MAHIPLQKLLPASEGSMYVLAVLAAKRAIQLADGDRALVDKPSEKFLDAALQEISEGKVKSVFRSHHKKQKE